MTDAEFWAVLAETVEQAETMPEPKVRGLYCWPAGEWRPRVRAMRKLARLAS